MRAKRSKPNVDGIVKFMYACAFLQRMDITDGALADALSHGLGRQDIRKCILALEPKHFYKTARSVKRPDANSQATFHCAFKGIRWYIKITFGPKRGKQGVWLVVTSFKELR